MLTLSRIGILCSTWLLLAATTQAALITVGNPGNAADTTGLGAVSYAYLISATEVSNSEYAAFLNATAATDTNSLYNSAMAGTFGGITQSGASGSFTYAIVAGRENNPVVDVSFYDALRYANWLHNGQPTGAQDNSTTEDGAYTVTSAFIAANSITRNAGAQFFLTSEDEWYKAAYYDPTLNGGLGGYFDYATSSDAAPTAEAPMGGSNSANYNQVVGNTTAVGAYTKSLSPYGTFDQSGNVSEWIEEAFEGSKRRVRDGNWATASNALLASSRGGTNPEFEFFNYGFRVASLSPIPEPSTFIVWSLLGMTVVGISWWKRRRKAA